MEVFKPIRNIWNQARNWIRASTTKDGISWMSRYVYRYQRLMLMNLGPREPATLHWPLYMYPPPHFLIGFHYLVRTCNDYIFDERTYSHFKFEEINSHHFQIVNWSVIANCSYTVNTGAYHRFLDLDNFDDTLARIQQSILLDRVVADLALIQPMRGFGITNFDRDENIPVEFLLQHNNRNINEEQIWGLADRIRIQNAGKKDVVVLQNIRRLKTAFFKFLMCENFETILSLPCDADWLEAFVEKFSDEDLLPIQDLMQFPLQKIILAIVNTLSLPNDTTCNLQGGAFELRPREGGRAVTEQMRRNRGEMIERFVDNLPIRRRRRRVVIPVEEVEEERTFTEEVRLAIQHAIQLLEHELTATQRNQTFFNFTVDYYNTFQRLEANEDVNETTLRRWVMYFFLTEHMATTLNYLNHRLRMIAPFNRLVELILAQVVLRARNETGNLIFSRVWNEYGNNSFSTLIQRISTDLSATVDRAALGNVNEEDLEQFMADASYQENSGDIQQLINQLQMNDVDVDSVELSFRFKVTGPVAFSQNREIQRINRRVIQHASALRQQRIAIPELNTQVRLPPE